ncbi:anion permease, partial [Escherichia sp. TWPC-MK]
VVRKDWLGKLPSLPLRWRAREKRMLGLMVGALVLWIFGGDYIDAAMVGYSVVALMLLLRIISWDDIVSNKAAWNVFFWLASLITLATGL